MLYSGEGGDLSMRVIGFRSAFLAREIGDHFRFEIVADEFLQGEASLLKQRRSYV